jgi:outer membrane protein
MKSEQCKQSSTFHILLLVLLPTLIQAQNVDDYVREGLKNNLLLQQKNLTLQQAEKSLQIARSFFLPSVTLLSDYTSGKGGRSIEIPVGDLLNPVYATLNQMTQSDRFPQIENAKQDFFPHDFYDARIRTALPLINTDLHYNRSIQGQQLMMKQYEVEIYKRQLVMELKIAYYNLLSARSVIRIYESAVALLTKNVKVNESLLANGKGLPAHVIRSKGELARVKADLNSARNQEVNAKQYFNFLLNRKLTEEVSAEASFEATIPPGVSPGAVQGEREEIKMLRALQQINESTVTMKQLNRLPKVQAFADVGTQATGWQVNNDSRYYLIGVQLSLPLFQGFRNNLGITQGKIEIRKNEKQMLYTATQLDLAAEIAFNDLNTAQQNHVASKEQLKSAQTYFNLIEKGYSEGVHPLIEFIDARDQLTTAELQQNLRTFELLIALARVERETASYNFEN